MISAISTVVFMAVNMVVMAVTEWNGVTQDMMAGVLTEIKSLLPLVAPSVIGFIGFRKAWGFIKSVIKGA